MAGLDATFTSFFGKKLEGNKFILKCSSWTPSEVTRRKSLASAYFLVPLMMGAG
jgi:hypothetical protein